MEHSKVVDPESAAHCRRAAAFAEKLAAGFGVRGPRPPQGRFLELATFFDAAVESAALEGISIAQAIAAFLEESGPGCEAARLVTHASKIETSVLSLPVIPKLASRLLRSSNDDISPAELEKLTERDPVLAGKLLGAANSALFGSRFEIVRLRDAIMRLGMAESRKIVMESCFAGIFASRSLQELWEHSQLVAADAGALAPLAGVDPEMAYVAGLLHDIGRLVFTKMPADLRIREQDWVAAGFPLSYAETLAYGLDHAEMGAQCLRTWELPDVIVDAVRLHHRPARAAAHLNAILTLAEDIAARMASAPSEDLWPEMRLAGALLNVGLTPAQLENFQRLSFSARPGAECEARAGSGRAA